MNDVLASHSWEETKRIEIFWGSCNNTMSPKSFDKWAKIIAVYGVLLLVAEHGQAVQELVIFCLHIFGSNVERGSEATRFVTFIYPRCTTYSYGPGFLQQAVLLTAWNVPKTSCSQRAVCCAFLNRRMFVLSRFLHFVHMAQLHLKLSVFIEYFRIQSMTGMERQSAGVNEYVFPGVSVKNCAWSELWNLSPKSLVPTHAMLVVSTQKLPKRGLHLCAGT